jgi:hypothetical protein
MGNQNQFDFGGMTFVTAGVTTGATGPGQAGSDLATSGNFVVTNLDAGASGTAGTVDVFPTTASKGKTQITCTSNTGNTTNTITNAAQSAACTWTIPDTNGSASFVMTAATQTVGGAKTFTGNNVHSGTFTQGSDSTDRVAIKGIYMNPSVIAVAVPTIANDAAENADTVAVSVASAFSMQPAVGDAVIAIPQEALPTDCLLCGAYVTATDEITLTFASKEGGGGVTGANKNFSFLVFDLT